MKKLKNLDKINKSVIVYEDIISLVHETVIIMYTKIMLLLKSVIISSIYNLTLR